MKKTNLAKAKKGFTIIEVVLVLAIAGLIFLMVFVALPALQSSQRDTQRKDDYALLATTITNYSSNNRGALPAIATYAWNGSNAKIGASTYTDGFLKSYLQDGFIDPNGNTYLVSVQNGAAGKKYTLSSDSGATTVYVIKSAKCTDGAPEFDSKLGDRRYAVYGYLESGAYCNDN